MKRTVILVLLLISVLIGLSRAPEAEAAIFDADSEVTYKEYWMDHSEFTGGCTEDGLPEDPNGSWYVEPGPINKCPKVMDVVIPDNVSGALRAEVYIDLWRNYDEHSARFRLGGSPTVYTPNAGTDWGRSPWVGEIPLSALSQTTTFTFWAEHGLYHIHDLAIRVYYDAAHPIVGADVTPPNGQLLTISTLDNGVELPINTGGLLMVNNDQLTLKAVADADAKYVEFHAYYDGYDVDADGDFIDWQNTGRNNWWPGGQGSQNHPNGGTINHVGTAAVPVGGGEVSVNWNIPHVINQSGVKFKIRIVDKVGNVREAAGGVSPEYTLARDFPVVYYTLPGFRDVGLHMSGTQPDTASYIFPMPADYSQVEVSDVYLLGMYWKRPRYSFNGMNPASISEGGGDEFALGIRSVNKAVLTPGNNGLTYSYSTGIGQFVEEPGPMLVVRGNETAAPDLSAPYIAGRQPAPNATNVDVFTTINANLNDLAAGVDKNSVVMSVNGKKVTPVFSGTSSKLVVSYVPTQPLPANTQIPVTVYGCDLLGNCMTAADYYTFTTEPPDITPPQITNINVVTTDTGATITWTTDEAADSKVEYGLTPALEKPAVSDAALVTKHTLQLTGLQTESTYSYRLTSRDFNENSGFSAILTFQTKRAPGAIVSDDFSACELDSSTWSYINPLGDSPLTLTGTGAQISVPTGAGHDIWKAVLNSPRLMQFVSNQNFDVEVKFDNVISKKTQSIGILVQQDGSNYLRIGFQSDGTLGTSLVVVNSVGGNSTVVFTTKVGITAPSYLRLNRTGDIWNVQYSIDGQEWTLATDYTRTLTVSQIGPYVGNTGTDPAHVNVIDYFISLADPLDVEDPPIELNVTKTGQGTITRDPDKASYGCNETVTLTATPAPDWTFAGWGGALSGTETVKTITLTQSESVTALFTNTTQYTLGVNVVSVGEAGVAGGTVSKDPDAATYAYGTEVELTAAPTPGWSFMGWSGDWSGTDLVTTVPVTGNMDITATFDQDEYTIETLIITEGVGQGGTIEVDPVKPTYLYGEPVTITVTPELGWTFTGWADGSQGVSGTEQVVHLNMSQNVVAIARLVQNQYDLNVTIINNGEPGAEGGAVVKNPNQETYGHGQVVTVTAVAGSGWIFNGWAGDLTGADPTGVLTMDDDKAVSAEFTQQQYTVTVTTEGPGVVNITPEKPYYLYGDVVTLTPVAEPGYEFALWTGDLTGTAEPAIVVIEDNIEAEALFVVDLTPIEILSYDVEVLPGGTAAVISWVTDVPGNSRVDYGLTEFYEGGAKTEDALVTEHAILLSGLAPETFYHFQLTSVDQHGNEITSDDLTFSTSESSGIFSDDFAGCELDDRWTWVNPLDDGEYTISGRQIELSVPNTQEHNLWSTGIDVPRLMQPSNDTDFTIEVKFDSNLDDPISMQGILVQQDAQTFLRFEFHKRQDGLINVYAATFSPAVKVRKGGPNPAEVPAPMYMRVVRTGDKWEQWYKLGETGDWVKNVEFTFEVDVNQVGFYAGNTRFGGSIPAHSAVVDYFFNTASPIDPEDSHYDVNVSIEGGGRVTRNPNRGYYCGQEVTLTATPDSGWIFLGWTGDASGNNPVRRVTVTQDMNITAEFVESSQGYKLSVPIVMGQ